MINFSARANHPELPSTARATKKNDTDQGQVLMFRACVLVEGLSTEIESGSKSNSY